MEEGALGRATREGTSQASISPNVGGVFDTTSMAGASSPVASGTAATVLKLGAGNGTGCGISALGL